MGISENEQLYEMTAQGKKWWGDPASPDYSKDGMNPFGKSHQSSVKLGPFLSEKESEFILQTLFVSIFLCVLGIPKKILTGLKMIYKKYGQCLMTCLEASKGPGPS